MKNKQTYEKCDASHNKLQSSLYRIERKSQIGHTEFQQGEL